MRHVKNSLVVLQRDVKVQSRDQVGGRDVSIRSWTTEVAGCVFLTPGKGCDCVPCFSRSGFWICTVFSERYQVYMESRS